MAFKLPFKLPPIHLGPRTRKILRYVGFTMFGIVVFIFALQLTFPFDRVKEKGIEWLATKDYDATIGSVERGIIPGRVYFKNVQLRKRPSKPEETVTPFFINEVMVDVGLLPLIGGTIAVDLEATLGDKRVGFGTLEGSLELEKFGAGSVTINFEGDKLPGEALPLRDYLGLPMTGKLNLNLALHLPSEKSKTGKASYNWQKSGGGLSLTCSGSCTFGDGKTKLKPLLKQSRNQVMVGEGIEFGKVTMETLAAKVSIKKGKLTLDKFDTTSKDGQLKIDFMLTLDKSLTDSMVAGCLRFKGSDDLLRREPKTHAALSTTGAEIRGDGLFHIRLSDRLKDMKRLNQECGPGTNIGMGENFSAKPSERPNLTIQPNEAAQPTPTTPTPPAAPTTPTMPSATPPPPAAPPTQDAGSATPTPPAPGTAAPPGAPPAPGTPGSATGSELRGEPGSAVPPPEGAPPANRDGAAPPPPQQ